MHPILTDVTIDGMLQLPKLNNHIRLLAVGYGLLILIWMSLEDNAVLSVTLLGAGLALLVSGLFLLSRAGGRAVPPYYVLPAMIALGILVGLGTSAATAGLMFFKNAMHAHVFLDFPPGLMLAILERASAWALAGGLTGLGGAFTWLALHQKTHESN